MSYYKLSHTSLMRSFEISTKVLDQVETAVNTRNPKKVSGLKAGANHIRKFHICYLAYGSHMSDNFEGGASPCEWDRLKRGEGFGGIVGEYLKDSRQSCVFQGAGWTVTRVYKKGSPSDLRPYTGPNGKCDKEKVIEGLPCPEICATCPPLSRSGLDRFDRRSGGNILCSNLLKNWPISVSEWASSKPTCGVLAFGAIHKKSSQTRHVAATMAFYAFQTTFCDDIVKGRVRDWISFPNLLSWELVFRELKKDRENPENIARFHPSKSAWLVRCFTLQESV